MLSFVNVNVDAVGLLKCNCLNLGDEIIEILGLL